MWHASFLYIEVTFQNDKIVLLRDMLCLITDGHKVYLKLRLHKIRITIFVL